MDAKAVETVHALATHVTGCPETVSAPAWFTAAQGGGATQSCCESVFPLSRIRLEVSRHAVGSVIKRAVLTLAFHRQIICHPFKLIHFIKSVDLMLSPKN